MPITCITFDLDDTLWECGPVIVRAEQTFYAWLQEHYPEIVARYSLNGLVEHRRAYFEQFPEMQHDFTSLRKQWLGQLGQEHDCVEGLRDHLVDHGFRVFWEGRNEVELYDEAVTALEDLSGAYRLGAITNGNADVHHIGIGHFFDFVVTSAGAGAAKPHPDIFRVALGEAGVPPNQVVHVGDDPNRDVLGAAAAGMRTVWVNPDRQPWPGGGHEPDAVVETVGQLEAVLRVWG